MSRWSFGCVIQGAAHSLSCHGRPLRWGDGWGFLPCSFGLLSFSPFFIGKTLQNSDCNPLKFPGWGTDKEWYSTCFELFWILLAWMSWITALSNFPNIYHMSIMSDFPSTRLLCFLVETFCTGKAKSTGHVHRGCRRQGRSRSVGMARKPMSAPKMPPILVRMKAVAPCCTYKSQIFQKRVAEIMIELMRSADICVVFHSEFLGAII